MADLRNIYVVPYDPTWVEKYEVEATTLRKLFGDNLIEIHHVGSTSIPNMTAKPIIDMMPVVHDITAVDELNAAMIDLGYEPCGEYGIAGRRYFYKGSDQHRTHHVHAFEPNNPQVPNHLDFRDYLCIHPDDAQAYADLKIQVAKDNPYNIQGYIDGKHAFIQEIIAKAQTWRKSQ